LYDIKSEIVSITRQKQININDTSFENGISLILSKKLTLPSSVTIGEVYRSTIVEITTTVIVRAFLRKLSFIKNIGNKMLVIIVDIEPIKKIAFQLISNIFIFKVEVSCTRNLASIIPIILPIVIARLVIKTYK
jgi:hypothetical protein